MFWICSFCNYVNQNTHSCFVCNNNNSNNDDENNDTLVYTESNNVQSSLNNISIDFSWNCSFCTFINKSLSSNCEMCGNPVKVLSSENARQASSIMRMESIDETVIPDDLKKDMEKAKKIRDQIIMRLPNNSKFTDEEFSPMSISIGVDRSSQSNFTHANRRLTTLVKWLRPEDLRGDEYSNSQLEWAVTRNPSSEDIVQGRLGNCWLLTGLALIADRSNLLDRILITKHIDPFGIYQVRLCKDGMWTVVTIDDLFPANQFDQMIYSRANRKQLWVSIIEKAAAKLYGSYESLTLGYCADGLSTLTGSPCETLKLSDLLCSSSSEPSLSEEAFGSVENISFGVENEEKDTVETIWAKLLSAKDADFVMCVSCGSHKDNELLVSQLHHLGLSNLHAYAILDVKDIPNANVRLLRLKNPWARLAWKGEWSDSHPCWNNLPSEIRNELQPPGVTGESCGVFWISWSDVLTYFFALDICRYQSCWHELRMQTHLPWPVWKHLDTQDFYIDVDRQATVAVPESGYITLRAPSPKPDIEQNNTCAVLSVLEPTQFQIVLWQSNCRSKENKPIDIFLVICKDYNETIGKLAGSSNRQTSSYVTCDIFLDPGIYTIFYLSLYHWQANINWDVFSDAESPFLDFSRTAQSDSLFECSLSIHSSKPVLLNRAILTPGMIPRVISELALQKGRKQLFGKIQVFTLMKGYSGMIMLIVNPPGNTEIRCTSDSAGSTNVRNSRGKNFLKSDDIISPGFCQLTSVLTQEDPYSSFSLQHKYTASISHTKSLTEYPELFGAPSQHHWPPIQLILHEPMPL